MREVAPPSLAELERQAAARRDGPAYGEDALISCDRLVRIFTADGVEVQALQGLDLLVGQGELMALVGASGSGKSTLLNILAGLDVPTAGAASVGGYDLLAMDAGARLRYRREVVGFVWQQTARNLLPYLTAAQNVVLPMQLAGRGGFRARRQRAARADELLDMLGVGYCRDRRPGQMSGGEQQRAAIAVALANNPRVILADEPTGELDSATGEQVFASFRTANEELGTTVVVVTHDHAVANAVRRTVAIRDGRTASEVVRRTEVDEHGQESVVAREYATVDRAGRLQLPRDYTEALEIRSRVLLELEPDHIGVWPDRPHSTPGTASPASAAGPAGAAPTATGAAPSDGPTADSPTDSAPGMTGSAAGPGNSAEPGPGSPQPPA
ncbi:ABC-type lipoprotein export system, ATPase component [Actinacidiphila guanduensis]|uniref:ABC-type lipoprotein export system, ATPase component n=1 Tax=Actinacidiphila guanduensis TaxID=310781 RepID=A0A1H0GMQ7_9ACTN|nr:ABC-type lipoprotein export system, ATPase component [Actinacidiphila guanduensis]